MDLGAVRLRELGGSVRAGLSFLLLTLLGGLCAAGGHLVLHHENRDERPGLSMDDLTGVYHGIDTTAPLVSALRRGHAEGLSEADRELLLKWLAGDRISEYYDSLELGDSAPAEVLDRNCRSCHARQAQDGGDVGQRLPLEYWDDVRVLAVSRSVEPVATEILIASAHTHALGMGSLTIVVALLSLMTRWPRRVIGGLILLSGLGLCLDLGSWLLARSVAALVPVIAVSGAVWMATTALLIGLSLLELWLPARPRTPVA